jgi:FkbH-like protein
MSTAVRESTASHGQPRSIKLLVWDLDDTLWEGTLLEGDDVRLRPGVAEVLAELDRRGVLHSIASRNDPDSARAALERLGVADYFLYPQLHWGAKSESIRAIAEAVNLGLDALGFVDDQEFECEEVRHVHPGVLTLLASELDTLLDRPELKPRFLTDESRLRRQMYRAEMERKQIELRHDGPQEDFLASLDMRFTIAPATEMDLQRAEELTVRTNQLNATGYTYAYEELDRFRRSPSHLLLVASLEDRFGTYGKIGLALVEKAPGSGGQPETWTLKLLLMSCRVMSRGAGSILLAHVLDRARTAGARLLAEFRPTARNRVMYVTYKFAGFQEVARTAEAVLFEHPLESVPAVPGFVRLEIRE